MAVSLQGLSWELGCIVDSPGRWGGGGGGGGGGRGVEPLMA